MQRLGQLILCLTLLLFALIGLTPAMGTSLEPFDLAMVNSRGASMAAVNAAQVVPLALVLIFATLILLSTPRDSGQNH